MHDHDQPKSRLASTPKSNPAIELPCDWNSDDHHQVASNIYRKSH